MNSMHNVNSELDNEIGDEPDDHIHVQLKKAADIMHEEVAGKDGFKTLGGADVKFEAGTRFVYAVQAAVVVAALTKLKPAEREKIHGHIQKSFANFKAIHRLIS